MVPSVDGRIVLSNWAHTDELTPIYERIAKQLRGDAWIIGRVSMQGYAGKGRVSARKKSRLPRTDFVAATQAKTYAIAIDQSGKLPWHRADIDGEHVITVLSERVSDGYLAHLQEVGVSYIFAGKRDIDLPMALGKLRRLFGIKRLLLEGGGHINGSFLAADLIDELSIIVAPYADGHMNTATLFDAPLRKSKAKPMKLLGVKRVGGDFVWLRYAL